MVPGCQGGVSFDGARVSGRSDGARVSGKSEL